MTTDNVSALHRVCSITRMTRLMRSQGGAEPSVGVVHFVFGRTG